MTIKQKIGKLVFKNLPFSKHVFNHMRLELNAIWVRLMHKINPVYIHKVWKLKKQKNLLINLGCGPYGKEYGWINLDLFPIQHVYIRADCRKELFFSNNSCLGVYIEMFLEHVDPFDELPFLLKECYRVLMPKGVLRIIVPDAEKFINAYVNDGWDEMNSISYGKEDWSLMYSNKMEALNHVFLQGYEHFGGWDFERLKSVLQFAGFVKINLVQFNKGVFKEIIDREFHKENGLYVEAIK
jgi:predicted SAM-dependent methyltransferase